MQHLTPDQIADLAADKAGQANIRAINALFRKQDESNLWPISGKFNATNRAIRRANQFQRESGDVYGLEYAYLVDSILSEIVNSAV